MVKCTTGTQNLEALERRHKAVELRLQGLSYSAIGKAIGVSTVHAFRYVRDAMALSRKKLGEEAEAVVHMELLRLDSLWKGLWAKASTGDARAIEAALRIMARRADLLGLDAPKKTETEMKMSMMSDAELITQCEVLGIPGKELLLEHKRGTGTEDKGSV